MTSDYLKTKEVQQMLPHDEAFGDRMTELKYLANALLEGKHLNTTLKEQLKRATKIQLKVETTLNEIETQLQQQFEKVSVMRMRMCSKNVVIGLPVNNTTVISVGSPHEHVRPQCDGRTEGEIQEISSDDEQQNDLPQNLNVLYEHAMQLETMQPKIQIHLDWKRNTGASERNVSESEAYTIVEKSNAEVAFANHLMEEVLPQPKSTSPVDNTEQFELASHLKKRQADSYFKELLSIINWSFELPPHFELSRKSNDASVTTTPDCRKQTKPYPCDLCDKAFVSPSKLAAHRRIHTGEKPFKCTICDVAFNVKGSLTMHQKIHSGAKLYKCAICNHTFRDKRILSRHRRTHLNEKPIFKCLICNATFKHKNTLSLHAMSHAKDART